MGHHRLRSLLPFAIAKSYRISSRLPLSPQEPPSRRQKQRHHHGSRLPPAASLEGRRKGIFSLLLPFSTSGWPLRDPRVPEDSREHQDLDFGVSIAPQPHRRQVLDKNPLRRAHTQPHRALSSVPSPTRRVPRGACHAVPRSRPCSGPIGSPVPPTRDRRACPSFCDPRCSNTTDSNENRDACCIAPMIAYEDLCRPDVSAPSVHSLPPVTIYRACLPCKLCRLWDMEREGAASPDTDIFLRDASAPAPVFGASDWT